MTDLSGRPEAQSLAPAPKQQMVPVPFAEKAMASLMQLHGELMEEKERRVDLYRRLMEKEQALAELKMYVKLLEEKTGGGIARAAAVPVPPRPPPRPPEAPRPEPLRAARVLQSPPRPPPAPAPAPARQGRPEGWKAW